MAFTSPVGRSTGAFLNWYGFSQDHRVSQILADDGATPLIQDGDDFAHEFHKAAMFTHAGIRIVEDSDIEDFREPALPAQRRLLKKPL
jgi:hypothetical protein